MSAAHNDDGIPEGGRNSSLFNVGVYFRKKNPDDWQEDLMKFNYEHVDEPLPATEINGLIKAVLKKIVHTPVNKHQYVITVNDLNVSKETMALVA